MQFIFVNPNCNQTSSIEASGIDAAIESFMHSVWRSCWVPNGGTMERILANYGDWMIYQSTAVNAPDCCMGQLIQIKKGMEA